MTTLGLGIGEREVTMREGAADRVLTAKPDRCPFAEKRRKGERLGNGPRNRRFRTSPLTDQAIYLLVKR